MCAVCSYSRGKGFVLVHLTGQPLLALGELLGNQCTGYRRAGSLGKVQLEQEDLPYVAWVQNRSLQPTFKNLPARRRDGKPFARRTFRFAKSG